MTTPTCATCQYCRPFHGRSYVCAVLYGMGLYSHIYTTDTACRDYSPKEPQAEKEQP